MARKKDSRNITYTLYPNTLPEVAGCHAVVSHVESTDGGSFFEKLVRRGACRDAATARLVFATVAEKAAEILSERQYRIVLDDMTLELGLSGSSTSLDGELSEDSELYVLIHPSDRIRNAAAGLAPIYVPLSVQPRIDFVEDVSCGTKGPKGVISGLGPFRLAVFNATATGEGESVTVTAKDGTVATATVTAEDGLGTSITAVLDATLPPGKATVTLTTRGWLTPEGNPLPLVKTVTIVAGEEPPAPTGPTVNAINDGSFHAGGGNVVTGVNMRFADDYPSTHVVVKNSEGEDMGAMISDDLEVPFSPTRFGLNIDEGNPLTDGEEYTFEFEMVDADGQPVTVTSKARWQAS